MQDVYQRIWSGDRTLAFMVFLSLIAMSVIGCRAEPMPAPTSGQLETYSDISSFHADLKKTVVVSSLYVNDFGWTENNDIYYGVGGDPAIDSAEAILDRDETAWYVYDIGSETHKRIEDPYPRLTSNTLSYLKHGQTNTILSMAVSPNLDKVIYTQLPDGYQRPKPLPQDYIDPAELWVMEDLTGSMEEGNTYPLLSDQERLYDCGLALSADSRWLYDETLVFGSCYFPFGITRVYFLADLLNRNIQFLNFEDESGEYVPTEEITIAHHSPSLAFSANGSFWMIPIENELREAPLKLTEFNFVFDDRPAVGPVWSRDDQWIYYWTYGKVSEYDENGFVKYQSWWLEKIKLTTRERVIVLSEKDLVSLLGYDMYRRNTPLGSGNPWKLSPDEKSMLLFLSETVDTESSLLLISWP